MIAIGWLKNLTILRCKQVGERKAAISAVVVVKSARICPIAPLANTAKIALIDLDWFLLALEVLGSLLIFVW